MVQACPFQPRSHPPDRLAFRMCATGEEVSFGELEARANRGAHLLRSLGVRRGDHIAILMENRCAFLELCFAADRTGVYYTTISTHLTRDEISYICGDCGAKVLITSPKFRDVIPTGDFVTYLVGEAGDLPSWDEAVAGMPATPIADEAQGLDMLYSSGTTGRPKGIKWPLPEAPYGSSTMLIELLTELFGYSAGTRYLCPAPLYHAAPLRHTMVTLKMGGSAFIMDRFDAEQALHLIERHRITHSQWVPTMFVRLLKLPPEIRSKYDLSSMTSVIHAAAPCPVDIKHRMIDWWGPIINEYYSGTENNGFTAITSAEWLAHEGSVGRSKLGVPHICDADGKELPVGEEGEIYFENGHQFAYHNDPVKTAEATHENGWTTLGDIGRLDDDGYLYLTDRKSFVIISGGVNVYPQEAENALLSHPAVLDVAVIGVPNEELGQEVKAIVQLVPDETATEDLTDQLIAFCRARISPIKCPRTIEFRSTLPRLPNGKLYKRKLVQEYLETA
jgi:fatty-acyl-CoA synthase